MAVGRLPAIFRRRGDRRGRLSRRVQLPAQLHQRSRDGALRRRRGLLAAASADERSFLVQGVLIFAGAVVVWPLFPRGLARLALGLIAASGLGVAVVGLAPEDAAPGWHYLGAAENLLLSNTGAALIGAALLREKRAPRAVGLLSLGFGLIGLAGLAGLAVRVDFGLGAGVIERIAAYPFPLWLAGMGVWLVGGGGETRR
jgi:hypothetical membrane protein